MSIQEMKDREIIREYYSFLYDLAAKKEYLHSSQMTLDEKRYCEKLLSHNKSKFRSNEMYLPVMENILRNHYSSIN